jgi:sugar/nucleoside kinase (ribokinase family)
MADYDLVVVGDVNPDLVVRGEVRPEFGQAERLVDDAQLVIGGSGAIMACGAARLDLRTVLCGAVGDDVFGRFMLDALGEAGVDTGGVIVSDGKRTGLSVILSGAADRAILTFAGSIGQLEIGDIDPDLVRSARHLHLSSYFLQRALHDGVLHLFGEAHRAGATTSVDPNWDPNGTWDGALSGLLNETDVFLPNEAEARAVARAVDATDAARALALRAGVVAVKCGPAGAVAVEGEEAVRAAAPAVDVADTIGAGDAFDAGFVAARLSGWPLERCLRLGVACGSLSTRAVGGTSAQPSMAEAQAAVENA